MIVDFKHQRWSWLSSRWSHETNGAEISSKVCSFPFAKANEWAIMSHPIEAILVGVIGVILDICPMRLVEFLRKSIQAMGLFLPSSISTL